MHETGEKEEVFFVLKIERKKCYYLCKVTISISYEQIVSTNNSISQLPICTETIFIRGNHCVSFNSIQYLYGEENWFMRKHFFYYKIFFKYDKIFLVET